LAEITVDTTNGTLRVHDGITIGGSNIATVAYVTSQISALSSNSISSGTSNIRVTSSGGNIAANVGATSNVLVLASTGAFVAGLISATGAVTAASTVGGVITGSSVSVTGAQTAASTVGGVITGSSASVSGAVTGASLVGTLTTAAQTNITSVGTLGSLSVTGNVQGGNLRTAGLVSATGSITGAGITGTSLTVSTGNITGGNIVNANANGVGNIGSATTFFNTVFAKATSAQYADLAEMYVADQTYAPGTVVSFGGPAEITQSINSHSTRVAGIISTNPSYLMNATLDGDHVVPVALTGRVPCKVIGNIVKGDRLVTSDVPGVATVLDMNQYQPACIIGKALENYNSLQPGVIEVAVGRT
jgi:hypothetical protein